MTILATTPEVIEQAAAELKAGRLVAFPTETVYGLGALATDDTAVARVFTAKKRPQFNPLISHFASSEAAMEYAAFTQSALRLADAFWPGPLTLIVDRPKDSPISLLASAGGSSLALRVPSHPVAQAVLSATAAPVVAPSANPSGMISPSSADHVEKWMASEICFVLDGGRCECGLESTVIDCRQAETPILLRPGPLSPEAIQDVTGLPLMIPDNHYSAQNAVHENSNLASPGQLSSHYAPRASVRMNAAIPQPDEAYLGFGDMPAGRSHFNLSETRNLTEAAANLFRFLHLADECGADVIAVAPVPNEGIGIAINDRLKRAAAPRS